VNSGKDAGAGLPTAQSRRWWVLAVVGIAQLMIVLDSTIVNIALPSAQRDLGFANSDRQWIVTAYALAFGSLLLLGGRLGDMFGRKWTFIGGLVGFAVASAAGGAAPDFAVLAAARALQGVFGALLAPSALTLLATTFTDLRDRGKAFAVFGAIAGGGGAVGLLLGGILTSYFSWRWCLYVNLFFAALAVVGALVFVTNPPRGPSARIDIPGVILASLPSFSGFHERRSTRGEVRSPWFPSPSVRSCSPSSCRCSGGSPIRCSRCG
jgi:MFS family permease